MFKKKTWLLLGLFCCNRDEPDPLLARLQDECSSPLEESAQYIKSLTYTEARAGWCAAEQLVETTMAVGATCIDGTKALYKNYGGGSELTLYFDHEQLVGVASASDTASCPSLCPLSHFWGYLEDLRCERPVFETLCADDSQIMPIQESPNFRLLFSDSKPPPIDPFICSSTEY